MKKLGLILIPLMLSTACTQFASNGDKQYLNNRNGTRLVVPPSLSDSNISHFYDLPLQNQHPKVNIAPPTVKIKHESS